MNKKRAKATLPAIKELITKRAIALSQKKREELADELIIEQEVYNICNQNRLCEIDLGETVLTCPTDCFAGGGHPELIDQVLGGSITISDIKISIIADIITISWVTDKPSSSVLVLADEIGNIEEFYLDELYSIDHSISLEDLIIKFVYN